jgi:hypothetical protein
MVTQATSLDDAQAESFKQLAAQIFKNQNEPEE